MPKTIRARAWNEYDSTCDQTLPTRWRIIVSTVSPDVPEWYIFTDDEVLGGTSQVEDVTEYIHWRSVTLSGRIKISDHLYEWLLSLQDANGYDGVYRVDGTGR